MRSSPAEAGLSVTEVVADALVVAVWEGTGEGLIVAAVSGLQAARSSKKHVSRQQIPVLGKRGGSFLSGMRVMFISSDQMPGWQIQVNPAGAHSVPRRRSRLLFPGGAFLRVESCGLGDRI
jgi:hypothetical protein